VGGKVKPYSRERLSMKKKEGKKERGRRREEGELKD